MPRPVPSSLPWCTWMRNNRMVLLGSEPAEAVVDGMYTPPFALFAAAE